uniref:Serine-threonine/tyrosine-protein kinase catalytic domain-containing protein n=1 Tax=Romanomermis culicivorax TaxID=13658 RepID=A0A915KM23_ROMCU
MLECWSRDPKSRPDYKICKDIVGEQLKCCCRRWYDDLVDILNDKESTSNYSTLRNSLIHFDQENSETSKLISPKAMTDDLKNNSGDDKVEILPRGDVYYNCSTLTTTENI